MQAYAPYLQGLAGQARAMADLAVEWVKVPSGSRDLAGLARMAAKLKGAFAALGGAAEEIELAPQASIDSNGLPCFLPLGKALRFRKRPDAPLRVFLGIHMDVVYGDMGVTETPKIRMDGKVLHASGGADAKGGLVIMLKALEAFEASPFAPRLGWEILINPDEELGSPGSAPLLREAAARNHVGLLFEPCLPDGALVGRRKGSGNFSAVVRGRAAHAGRDIHLGRNAISALAEFIVALDEFGAKNPGLSVNVGKVEGGGALNRVPDLAIGRFNLRVRDAEDMTAARDFLHRKAAEINVREGLSLELHGDFSSPPKIPDGAALELQRWIGACGQDLGLNLRWENSGGVSDGNKLAAAGLPNVDTLGAQGGHIHSPEEFLLLDSLPERARLTALILMRLASGEIPWAADKEEKKNG
jgi:glutamate carboxypeptidase